MSRGFDFSRVKFARVIRSGAGGSNEEWRGRIGKVVGVEYLDSGEMVTLDFNGELVVFEGSELAPAPSPGVRR